MYEDQINKRNNWIKKLIRRYLEVLRKKLIIKDRIIDKFKIKKLYI